MLALYIPVSDVRINMGSQLLQGIQQPQVTTYSRGSGVGDRSPVHATHSSKKTVASLVFWWHIRQQLHC